MAALTADTVRRTKGMITDQDYPVKAATEIFHGGLVATDATGFLVPASDTAGLRVVGIALEAADNSTGADGDLSVLVYRGGAKFATTGGSAIDQTDVGADAFVLDDDTVVKAAGTVNSILAGEVLEFDGTHAWINLTGVR